jgi:hypothetical protein
MAAAMAAFATTALAQTADTALPDGLQWTMSPASVLARWGWGGAGTQGDVGKGVAVVTCAYNARGVLSKCQAINEQPTGFLLGRTAISVAKRAKLKTTRSDGSALTPGTITFEVVFRDEDRSRSPRQTSGLTQQAMDRANQRR